LKPQAPGDGKARSILASLHRICNTICNYEKADGAAVADAACSDQNNKGSKVSSVESCFQINAPDVLAEVFGDEVVVLDTRIGRYFSLRGSGAHIWFDLVGGYSPSELTDLAKENPAFLQALDEFVDRLVSEGLLTAVQPDGSGTEKRHASRLAAAGLSDAPKLTFFDDMADLLLADPVHDVDEEAGWPVRRPTENA
jgi:hypothetical protein